MNRWAKWLLLVFFLSFVIPGLYIVGLDSLWDGWVVRGYEYLIYAMCLPFLIYPFWKGVRWYKLGKKARGILSCLIGIFMPVSSGLFGVFIFETLRISPYEKEINEPIGLLD